MSHPFVEARSTLKTASGEVVYYRLAALEERGLTQIDRLPFSIRVMLESVLRQVNGVEITEEDVVNLAKWTPRAEHRPTLPYSPARVVMQDFTGVPAVVDLAAMRSAMARLGRDPAKVNPLIPVHLIIDHSVQVDFFATPDALRRNVELEFRRNRERYEFLHWGQKAFDNFKVVPPATGIIHQVNLEYLARVVMTTKVDGETVAYPDTLVGTDSHTVMINGLGVVGWGVGGIEAEAAILGQPIYMVTPDVIGFKLYGELREGVTATDLVLTVTNILRQKGVVGKFVEFFGPGVIALSLPDRATIANMAPEYGATMGFFPVDEETLRYLRLTGRPEELIDLVERYTKAQGLFRTLDTPDPEFTDVVELDLSTVETCVAGPKRPQDRVRLFDLKPAFRKALTNEKGLHGFGLKPEDLVRKVPVVRNGQEAELTHGSVVIAAITSCTNTSNPSVLIAAGLLAKKAVEKGLRTKPYVKTSLAPGSRVVTEYLKQAGLLEPLAQLGFQLVGYGCTTCIGNSGPLPPEVAKAVTEGDLVVAAVSSGNRNFEGRVHPLVKAHYLMSPPLVVAYALAGTVDFDMATDPLGYDQDGNPVYLRDIWPSTEEIQRAIDEHVTPDLFKEKYADVFTGNEMWNSLPSPDGEIYAWSPDSTYIQEPPFFMDLSLDVPPITEIHNARALAVLGDSVTTDHISPAGAIPPDSPAGKHLISKGVQPKDFNSYGSRRGNHEVMMRGTFANIRLRNKLVPGVEGGYTIHLPDGEQMTIYDAAMKYQEEGVPLVVLAGKEYGTGSSRDWAAKGTALLGVKAVIAESFERIHRSNLVGMGVLPLQFKPGDSVESLGLTGHEVFHIEGLKDDLEPLSVVTVRAVREDGTEITFPVIVRLDTTMEITYYRNGGILHTVLRNMAREA
ncbi:MAG TPA: aconitate hydratase AcnA [Anaerolineae bacterium]|nr:aconitate hydratase AcnA [Anaerolineae bacterium]HID84567.1 aconitate hydratase AcnA [Anaerolineales bacterium]HIQ09334.1 aconitate hydratase AcnA [Anaerolineaceae bacterium]